MSMSASTRRTATAPNVEPFPERFGASQLVLSAQEAAAVSTMLRQAKSAIAALRQRVAALETELSEARDRACAAQEQARTEAEGRASEKAAMQVLEQQLSAALARTEALEAEMTQALNERDRRMWKAEARAQELEQRAGEAEERATAAEGREWEAKARLARAREALGE